MVPMSLPSKEPARPLDATDRADLPPHAVAGHRVIARYERGLAATDAPHEDEGTTAP
jgi:hypothetical protein